MKNITSKIVSSLNEGIDQVVVETERTAEATMPVEVHQCDNCADFYLVDHAVSESICPHCGGAGKPVGKVTDIEECDDLDKKDQDHIEESEDEEEIRSEAELVVGEALRALDHSDFRKFNESYRPRVRMTRKGELEAIMESTNGRAITAKRKMTSRQKAAYKLSENFSIGSTKIANKKVESIKVRRQELMMKNESRAMKVQACRILERQGAKYDCAKFNESMNKFIASRKYRSMLEDIAEDEIGKSELDKMTPDEIADQVNSVIGDTGIEVMSNDVDIDGDTATVTVRVEDNDQAEVHTSEIEDVLSDVFDAPVEIAGPYQSEGDKSVADLAVVINPDKDVNEDDEFDEEDPDLCEDDEDLGLDSEDDKKGLKSEAEEKFESIRRRGRRKMSEKFVKGTGETPLFALVATDSADNEPQFLAQDDSLVSGNEENAEDLARIFVSAEAASAYLQNAGLEDQYTPVSISIVANECDETPMKSEKSLTEADDTVETDDGSYFEKDGYFYCKDSDGKVREIDESEFEDAKACAADKLKESYKARRRAASRRK